MIPFAWPFVALVAVVAAFALLWRFLDGRSVASNLRQEIAALASLQSDANTKAGERFSLLESKVRDLGMRG